MRKRIERGGRGTIQNNKQRTIRIEVLVQLKNSISNIPEDTTDSE